MIIRKLLPTAIVVLTIGLSACVSIEYAQDGAPSGSDDPYRTEPVPRYEPRSRYGNHSPYTVLGQSYHVMPSAEGYQQRGIASWYGKKFHGRLTSNRETYDMYAYTAAHKSLPLPTYVEVINLSNGRSVVVRVNDRGPFKDNRIIDLSYAAAKKLDMIRDGTAFVEVKALMPGDPVHHDQAAYTGGSIFLQLGAFADINNASRLRQRLRIAGLDSVIIETHITDHGLKVHRVRIGPLKNVDHADRLIKLILKLGMAMPQIVSNDK